MTPQPPRPQLATITAAGGITAATMLIATAAGIEKNRTTFQASRIRTRQVPISQKYAFLRFTLRRYLPLSEPDCSGG